MGPCIPLPSELSHASGNSKQVWQIPDAACTDLSSWWWSENPLETCTALTIIKSIIQRCILLVMLKNNIVWLTTCTLKSDQNKIRFELDFCRTYPGCKFLSHILRSEFRFPLRRINFCKYLLVLLVRMSVSQTWTVRFLSASTYTACVSAVSLWTT
jgi:hypothetical protein